MGNPWKKHGENSMDSLENHGAWSWSKIPWFSWRNFHAFHASIEQENCKIFPMKAWKAWNLKPWKTMESMGIYKNESMESMGSMVFFGILLLIISRKHGKHGIYANEFTSLWLPGSSTFLASASTLVTWLAPSP